MYPASATSVDRVTREDDVELFALRRVRRSQHGAVDAGARGAAERAGVRSVRRDEHHVAARAPRRAARGDRGSPGGSSRRRSRALRCDAASRRPLQKPLRRLEERRRRRARRLPSRASRPRPVCRETARGTPTRRSCAAGATSRYLSPDEERVGEIEPVHRGRLLEQQDARLATGARTGEVLVVRADEGVEQFGAFVLQQRGDAQPHGVILLQRHEAARDARLVAADDRWDTGIRQADEWPRPHRAAARRDPGRRDSARRR